MTLKQVSEVVGIIIATITAILGLPVTIVQVRKTIAEIRKLELEVIEMGKRVGKAQKSLEPSAVQKESASPTAPNHRLPDALSPLYDFIISFTVILWANYVLNFFLWANSPLKNLVMALLASIWLVPVLVIVLRVRQAMRSTFTQIKK